MTEETIGNFLEMSPSVEESDVIIASHIIASAIPTFGREFGSEASGKISGSINFAVSRFSKLASYAMILGIVGIAGYGIYKIYSRNQKMRRVEKKREFYERISS